MALNSCDMSRESTAANAVAPSVDSSLGTKLLPGVLSIIAGSVDVICFLGLGGLFAAHITGNLVVLAAHIATGTVRGSRRSSPSRFLLRR